MQLGLAITLLAQIPQAALSATELYSKHPYLACFMFAAVLLVLLAFKVRGGGASDRFQVFDYRPWSWRRFWERRDVAKEDALADVVCDLDTKHRVVRTVKRQVEELVVSAADRALERGLAAGVASSVGMADFVGLVPGPPPSPPPACSQVGCWSARFGC